MKKEKGKRKRALTHASPVFLCLAQLDFFQLLLLRTLRTALPTRRTLLFQFCIVSREPDIRDELVKLGQSQHDAGAGAGLLLFLGGYSVEEKSVKIGCRRKNKINIIALLLLLLFVSKIGMKWMMDG
jgi:hypothetical protein